MKKNIALLLLILQVVWVVPSEAEAPGVRLKDIGKIIEARDNQLVGFGLVIGLRNSGDSKNTVFTDMALTNMLKKVGISGPKEFSSRNVASVLVTTNLPPYVKKGQTISVTVSSVGDSNSLVGGTLIMTPLQGADGKVYAVAQGPVIVGGLSEQSSSGVTYKNQPTVGNIPDGAIVENEVAVSSIDQRNITIVINDPNFITVTRAAKAIQANGFPTAKAIDANTIKVPLADVDSSDIVGTIAKLENITFTPDSTSKIVINSKTGTIVIGEMVRLSPVAITHGNISIRISNGAPGGGGGGFAATDTNGSDTDSIKIDEPEAKVVYLNPTPTLSSLVNALNEIGASPKDLISILQALKQSGALIGTIETI